MEYSAGTFDIAVIGAGHAGIEAALAAARLGLRTVCFTVNLDAVGNMPCNPAIGGTGKGHLVREIDALGGEMGRAADAACIQYRILNRGKGPAVWSLRAQADRRAYQKVMKHTLETQENLWVKQAEVVEIRTEHGAVSAVVTATLPPPCPSPTASNPWDCPSAASRRARPPGSTGGAWTSPKWSSSPGTRTPSPSPLRRPGPRRTGPCAI